MLHLLSYAVCWRLNHDKVKAGTGNKGRNLEMLPTHVWANVRKNKTQLELSLARDIKDNLKKVLLLLY